LAILKTKGVCITTPDLPRFGVVEHEDRRDLLQQETANKQPRQTGREKSLHAARVKAKSFSAPVRKNQAPVKIQLVFVP
jgi:hypothetical protein